MQRAGTTASEITEIYYSDTADGVEVVFRGNGTFPEPMVFEVEGKLIVDVPSVSMKAAVPTVTPYLVKKIASRPEGGKVRFVLDLAEGTSKEVYVVDDELVVSLTSKKKGEVKVAGATPQEEAYRARLSSSASSNGPKDGEMVNFDFQDANVVAVLRILSELSGYNIVNHPDIKGTITMRLIDVPREQALDTLAEQGWDWNKINVNGGAIALGHPLGASGATRTDNVDICAERSRTKTRHRVVVPRRR